jgi:predicted RNA-binding Zn-ribbon protein involved in translation (DUF1610 family)
MPTRARCDGCGFQGERGSDAWATVAHPSLGSLTACPECGSTQVHAVPDVS